MKNLDSAQRSKPGWYGAGVKIVDWNRITIASDGQPLYTHGRRVGRSASPARLEEHFSAEEKAKGGRIPVIVPSEGTGRMAVVSLVGPFCIESKPFVKPEIGSPA